MTQQRFNNVAVLYSHKTRTREMIIASVTLEDLLTLTPSYSQLTGLAYDDSEKGPTPSPDKLAPSALVELAVHASRPHQSKMCSAVPIQHSSQLSKRKKMLSKGLCLSYIFCFISLPTNLAWKSNAALTKIVSEEMMRWCCDRKSKKTLATSPNLYSSNSVLAISAWVSSFSLWKWWKTGSVTSYELTWTFTATKIVFVQSRYFWLCFLNRGIELSVFYLCFKFATIGRAENTTFDPWIPLFPVEPRPPIRPWQNTK